MIFLELLWGFLKVGLFSFGGAYAAIPLIKDVVNSYGWIDEERFSYMIGVSESTPGPIMVNIATYVGTERGGFLGALIATFAVVLPAFVIILLIMAVFKGLLENGCVKAVIDGIKPCVIGIILATGIYMLIGAVLSSVVKFTPDLKAVFILMCLILVLVFARFVLKKKLSPLVLIGVSAVLGAAVY